MSATSKLGSLLRRLREEKKITQEQLAESSGLSRTQIAYLETGKRGGGRIGWETMIGLARAFKMAPEEFAALLAEEIPVITPGARRKGRPKKLAAAKPATKRRKPK